MKRTFYETAGQEASRCVKPDHFHYDQRINLFDKRKPSQLVMIRFFSQQSLVL